MNTQTNTFYIHIKLIPRSFCRECGVVRREPAPARAKCIYTYTFIHIYIYTYIHMYVYIYIYIYIYMHEYINKQIILLHTSFILSRMWSRPIRACSSARFISSMLCVWVCMYVCIYIYIYINTYIYIYIHIYTPIYPHLSTYTYLVHFVENVQPPNPSLLQRALHQLNAQPLALNVELEGGDAGSVTSDL